MVAGAGNLEAGPYTAVFLPTSNDFANQSVAEVLIQPPFTANMDSILVDVCFDDPAHKVFVKHVVTTVSRSLVEITVSSDGDSEEIHDRRIQVAHTGVEKLINVLNCIETGSYRPDTN